MNQKESTKQRPSLNAKCANSSKIAGRNRLDRTIEHQRLLKYCLLELSKLGFFCWANATGAIRSSSGFFHRFGLKGSSDILGIDTNGKFIALEIKTGKSFQNKHQKNFEKAVLKRNGIYKIIRSEKDLKEWLIIYS